MNKILSDLITIIKAALSEHLPSFMVFYDNEEKLGAVKMDVYDAGDIVLYLFDDGGKNLHKEIPLVLDATREEFIETPATVSFVRISHEQFEKDQGQEIWFERWKEDEKD